MVEHRKSAPREPRTFPTTEPVAGSEPAPPRQKARTSQPGGPRKPLIEARNPSMALSCAGRRPLCCFHHQDCPACRDAPIRPSKACSMEDAGEQSSAATLIRQTHLLRHTDFARIRESMPVHSGYPMIAACDTCAIVVPCESQTRHYERWI